jgi:hypothetical protein
MGILLVEWLVDLKADLILEWWGEKLVACLVEDLEPQSVVLWAGQMVKE